MQQPTIQAVYRQAAVAYMGSLLSRAKFISIRYVGSNLIRYLEIILTKSGY